MIPMPLKTEASGLLQLVLRKVRPEPVQFRSQRSHFENPHMRFVGFAEAKEAVKDVGHRPGVRLDRQYPVKMMFCSRINHSNSRRVCKQRPARPSPPLG